MQAGIFVGLRAQAMQFADAPPDPFPVLAPRTATATSPTPATRASSHARTVALWRTTMALGRVRPFV